MTFFRQVPILSISMDDRIFKIGPVDSPSQHITLFSILDDEHQLIDTVDFVFDTLNQWTKGIGNIVDQGVGDPVRSD